MLQSLAQARNGFVKARAHLRRANAGLRYALLATIGALVLHLLNGIVQFLHS